MFRVYGQRLTGSNVFSARDNSPFPLCPAIILLNTKTYRENFSARGVLASELLYGCRKLNHNPEMRVALVTILS